MQAEHFLNASDGGTIPSMSQAPAKQAGETRRKSTAILTGTHICRRFREKHLRPASAEAAPQLSVPSLRGVGILVVVIRRRSRPAHEAKQESVAIRTLRQSH